MPTPTSKDVHVDAALSNVSIRHRPQKFVAERIFPSIKVEKSSDYYYEFLRGAFYAIIAGRRGPGANAKRSGYKLATQKYSCDEIALAHEVPIETIRRADNPLKPLETGTHFASNAVLLKKDVDMANMIMNTGNWTNTEDTAGGWAPTDSTNTFYSDILDGKETVKQAIGVYPNVMTIDFSTFKMVKQCSPLLDRIKYSGTQGKPADVTPGMIAALFELEEVIIADSVYSDAEETVAGEEFNIVNPWEVNTGKGSALLSYRPPAGEGAIDVPSAGYIFNEILTGDDIPDEILEQEATRIVRKWWEKSPKQWVVECAESYDMKICCPHAGFLFYDTILT